MDGRCGQAVLPGLWLCAPGEDQGGRTLSGFVWRMGQQQLGMVWTWDNIEQADMAGIAGLKTCF